MFTVFTNANVGLARFLLLYEISVREADVSHFEPFQVYQLLQLT
jgi:hypothetical protein